MSAGQDGKLTPPSQPAPRALNRGRGHSPGGRAPMPSAGFFSPTPFGAGGSGKKRGMETHWRGFTAPASPGGRSESERDGKRRKGSQTQTVGSWLGLAVSPTQTNIEVLLCLFFLSKQKQ
jgi:hypothetical protein